MSSPAKDQCFHATLPIKNDLKMFKLQAWSQKEDYRRRWLTEVSGQRSARSVTWDAQRLWCQKPLWTTWA